MVQRSRVDGPSQAEQLLRVTSGIAAELIKAHDCNETVSLNVIRAKISKKYSKKALLPKLKARPIRTASGIAVVAVMCKPHRCPHIAMTGNISIALVVRTQTLTIVLKATRDTSLQVCEQYVQGESLSTGVIDISFQLLNHRYDPYEQTRGRVEQLKSLGHNVDKVEFIIMGGTFMSMPEDYRAKFVAQLHNALSGFTGLDVDEAVSQMLRYGCTRLEIGVQSVYEDVARDTNRGHTVRAVCESFLLAKDAGFKVVAHMMPDLPNVGLERDLEQFKEYFESPAFRSDGLKIYPTLVIRGTGLYELWRTGRYKNYTPNVLVDVVARILARSFELS
ncbi:hypothetical protein MPER_12655 [Moniliophthora perniciosa FA553]|nr:hypothetical protein MPER_12655 [Moniliophthora perniciosa FA553]